MATRLRTRLGAIAAIFALILGVAGISIVRAGSPGELPTVPPDELLASSLRALERPFSVSGDVTTRFETGLPDLPGTLGGSGSDAGALALELLGTQHYRVWRSPDGLRIARVTDLSEQDLVANRSEAWYWDSNGMRAVRLDLAALTAGAPSDAAWANVAMPTRADLTRWVGQAIEALAPYADVAVAGTIEVAGRPAYDLELTPAPGPTLIGRVDVAIDGETRLPLRFSVTPKGADDPAIDLGFDAASFDAIDPEMFTFAPPPGADVTDVAAPAHGADAAQTPPFDGPGRGDVRVFGTGFSSRLAVRLDGRLPEQARALLPYAGPLLSAVTVARGDARWLLVGPVTVATLERDAAALA